MSIKDLINWPNHSNRQTQRYDSRESHPFEIMRRQMNTLFDSFFDENAIEGWGGFDDLTPRMDVMETEKDIRITAEIPGMNEKDISVDLDQNVLTIRGEKKREHEEKESDYYHVERSYGTFQRSLRLPQNVDEDAISANYKNGVLNLVIPKNEKEKSSKKITIQAD